MRTGMTLMLLAAAGLLLAGCEKLGDKVPSKPSSSDMPSTPATPAVSKPAAPSAPSTPAASTPAAPSAPSTSALPSKPATPDSASSAAKTVDAATPAAVDKTPIKGDVSKIKFTAEPAELFGYDDGESRAFFHTSGLGEVVVKVPEDGDYEIVITAACQAAKGENAKFKLKVDGAQVGAETTLKAEDAKDYAFTSALKAGDRRIGTEFTNDLYKEGEYDMNFFLHGVKVVRK